MAGSRASATRPPRPACAWSMRTCSSSRGARARARWRAPASRSRTTAAATRPLAAWRSWAPRDELRDDPLRGPGRRRDDHAPPPRAPQRLQRRHGARARRGLDRGEARPRRRLRDRDRRGGPRLLHRDGRRRGGERRRSRGGAADGGRAGEALLPLPDRDPEPLLEAGDHCRERHGRGRRLPLRRGQRPRPLLRDRDLLRHAREGGARGGLRAGGPRAPHPARGGDAPGAPRRLGAHGRAHRALARARRRGAAAGAPPAARAGARRDDRAALADGARAEQARDLGEPGPGPRGRARPHLGDPPGALEAPGPRRGHARLRRAAQAALGPLHGMSYESILFSVEDGIATISLHRPEKLNAYTTVMGDEVCAALDRARDDAAVRAVILTGSGRGFCAGVDLDHLRAHREGRNAAEGRAPRLGEERFLKSLPLELVEWPKPVIAAVNGPAIGVGVTMILPCDVRLAADTAKLGLTFAKLGILPGLGSTHLLPRLVGMGRALELVLSARVTLAAEAAAIGLVNRVVPAEALIGEARALARAMAECKPAVLAAAKRALRFGAGATLEQAMRNEEAQSLRLREGVGAPARDAKAG